MSLSPLKSIPLKLPVIAAPMFLASSVELVIAQCRAGIIGSFPALNARTTEELSDWLDRVEAGVEGWPFAVNQIVHRSNRRLEADMEVISAHRVPIVITSLGARPDINDAVHAYGGVTLHDVVNVRQAKSAIDKGADGLIAVAAGAGGHAGTQSPFALVREIREWFDGPLALSGAISHGSSVLAAVAAGADFAYVGSAFLATPEASVDARYKQMVVDGAASDIIYSDLFTGVHGNYLRASIERAGLDPDNLASSDPSALDFGASAESPVKAWRDIWGAGQGIGALHGVEPAAALIGRLRAEFDAAGRHVRAVVDAVQK